MSTHAGETNWNRVPTYIIDGRIVVARLMLFMAFNVVHAG